MKERLLKLLKAKQDQRDTLNRSMIESDNKEERQAIGDTLKALAEEIAEVEQMLADVDAPAEDTPSDNVVDDANEEQASKRGLNILGAMTMRGQEIKKVNKLDTEEYRNAFMNFCKNGTPIPSELRADAITTTSENSAVIPTTLLNEIVKELKTYGLYQQVRHLNVQGGVEIPVLSLKPTATWISADTGTSESDKKKLTTTKISFSYFGLECKIAQTLLVNVTTIEAFQELFVPLAVESIAEALDHAIINGTGSGQPLGVAVDTRVPASNKITLSSKEIASWSDWKKKVFAKMKKSYRDGKFFMAQSTFDGYIDGMVDSTGQPIGRVNYGIDGAETYRFGGKDVETLEDSIITSYDDASEGEVIAVFFKPSDYAINSNLEMQTIKWVDHDTNEIKNKVIMICDGKLIDPNGVIIIKKGAVVQA